jgi:hypothetical protein
LHAVLTDDYFHRPNIKTAINSMEAMTANRIEPIGRHFGRGINWIRAAGIFINHGYDLNDKPHGLFGTSIVDAGKKCSDELYRLGKPVEASICATICAHAHAANGRLDDMLDAIHAAEEERKSHSYYSPYAHSQLVLLECEGYFRAARGTSKGYIRSAGVKLSEFRALQAKYPGLPLFVAKDKWIKELEQQALEKFGTLTNMAY